MGTTGHTITVGDEIPASVNGESRLLTITRITAHGIVYTDDWRGWWYRWPGHQDGTPIHPSASALHVHLANVHRSLATLEAAAA